MSQNEGGGKFVHQKKRFYTQKHQKNPMSKNGIKNRLALLFRELWAFLFFRKNKINAKGWRRKKGGRGVKFFYQKKVLIFLREIKTNFSRGNDHESSVILRWFFFDKKCDLSLWKFKKSEPPKMVLKRLKSHYLRSYEQF